MKKESIANFTLKSTNKRIDSLETKIDQILKITNKKQNEEEDGYILSLNTKTLKSDVLSDDEFLITMKSLSKEFALESVDVRLCKKPLEKCC